MASQNWYPPLPPGWEARWDQNQRAFFYIDHTTKTTSWEDPRWANKQKGQETSFTDRQEEDRAKIIHLRARFPEADPIINDILNSCGRNEDEAARQLMELGFKSRGNTSSSHASPARSKGKQSTTTSPQRTSSATPKTKASPARQQSPAKPQLSEAEKIRRLDRLCGEFKSLEREVVKMALESCQYEESKARTTLTRVASQWQSGSSSRERSAASASSSGSRGGSTHRPSSPRALGAPASMEPVALSQDRPSPTRTTGGATTTGRQTVSTRTIITGSSSVTGKKTTTKVAAPKPQQQQQQRRAKHVTIVTTQGGQQDRDRVVTTQPRPQPHAATTAVPVHHGGSGLARGADPTLHAGPDPDLAAGPEPGLYFGPNPELCDGPDPDLLQGASEAAEGPNPEYYQGKVPDLAGGSFGSCGPNPTLRCAAEYTSPIGVDQRYLQTTI